LPANSLIFLRGMRLLPPRAGITANETGFFMLIVPS
jgi:hypothetical protein